MNFYWIFYLYSIVNNLSTFFGWFCVIFTLISVVSWVLFFVGKGGTVNSDNTETEKQYFASLAKGTRPWVWWATTFMTIFWLAYVATPSKKDMLLIVIGGTVGNYITTDKNAKQLPNDVVVWMRAEILKATSELKVDLGDKKKTMQESQLEDLKKLSKEQLEKLLLKNIPTNVSIDSLAKTITQ